MSLISHKDLNSATVLTLWQDEESLKTSEKEVFGQATKKVKDTLESPTRIENYRMFSAIFPVEGEIKSIHKGLTSKFVFLKK